MARIYIVAGIDVADGFNNEEIDNILNEMDYSFEHPHIKDAEIVENQFPYVE